MNIFSSKIENRHTGIFCMSVSPYFALMRRRDLQLLFPKQYPLLLDPISLLEQYGAQLYFPVPLSLRKDFGIFRLFSRSSLSSIIRAHWGNSKKFLNITNPFLGLPLIRVSNIIPESILRG